MGFRYRVPPSTSLRASPSTARFPEESETAKKASTLARPIYCSLCKHVHPKLDACLAPSTYSGPYSSVVHDIEQLLGIEPRPS
ncbi:MAG: hypothetical protein Q8P35_00685 [Candidatus Yanofskybacteria bacterium]|nr:hypothetical protein [Candidatus Yanofskybacteria bacterium]